MTRAEIEEILEVVSEVERYSFKTDREKIWYKIGCIAGLKVADAKPNLESIWHNISEEPRLNQWFIAQIGDNAFDTFVMTMDRNQDWRTWSKGLNIKRWAYIGDLLPKGGER